MKHTYFHQKERGQKEVPGLEHSMFLEKNQSLDRREDTYANSGKKVDECKQKKDRYRCSEDLTGGYQLTIYSDHGFYEQTSF